MRVLLCIIWASIVDALWPFLHLRLCSLDVFVMYTCLLSFFGLRVGLCQAGSIVLPGIFQDVNQGDRLDSGWLCELEQCCFAYTSNSYSTTRNDGKDTLASTWQIQNRRQEILSKLAGSLYTEPGGTLVSSFSFQFNDAKEACLSTKLRDVKQFQVERALD